MTKIVNRRQRKYTLHDAMVYEQFRKDAMEYLRSPTPQKVFGIPVVVNEKDLYPLDTTKVVPDGH